MENNSEPSLTNPTWEYLHSNFRKIELQKHCRELGLTKIWVTKANLIDMIMEKVKPTITTHGNEEECEDADQSSASIRSITRNIVEINEKLKNKDEEIRMLKEELNTAQGTIDKLISRVSSMEKKIEAVATRPERQDSDSHPSANDTLAPPTSHFLPIQERTLLLGDGNLSQISTGDLKDNCSIRTIEGANIDVIKCWVSEKLTWKPTKCIIYGGMQDILDSKTPNVILDTMGDLISSLKEKNENMIIYICEIVPVAREEDIQSAIKDYNNKLIEWSFNNSINIIKTDLPFRIATGEMDDMCTDVDLDSCNVNLNRFGVIRQLDTILKQHPDIKISNN